MTSAQVVTETPVTITSFSFQNYTHMDGHPRQTVSFFLQFLRSTFNPYRWHKSHENIKSEIVSLDFTDENGAAIPIEGDNLEIDVRIPLNSLDSSSNTFFVSPLTMRYHTVELTDISDSMILEVKPINRSLIMVVYVKKGERPTLENYNYSVIVPDYTSCKWKEVDGDLVAKCERSPYEVMSTAEFNETGLYYVGVLYFERDQLKSNHSRTRRSCFGRGKQKRDCVEPKPPPVKDAVPNRTLIYNPTTDQNYSVKVRKYSCYYFALTQDEWRKDGCKVSIEFEGERNITIKGTCYFNKSGYAIL